MKLTPSNGRIIVEELGFESESSIIHVIRETKNEKFVRGKVVAASNGFYTANGTWISATVHAGDIVWYNKFNVAELKIKGTTYHVMPEGEALATEQAE